MSIAEYIELTSNSIIIAGGIWFVLDPRIRRFNHRRRFKKLHKKLDKIEGLPKYAVHQTLRADPIIVPDISDRSEEAEIFRKATDWSLSAGLPLSKAHWLGNRVRGMSRNKDFDFANACLSADNELKILMENS